MRKIVVSLAAAGAAFVVASPAAAQYYPQPQQQPYGYGNGYGGQQYGGGYGGYGFNNYGQVRQLQARIDRVEWQINRLDRVDGRTAYRLRDEANRIERRLRERARGGLNPYEVNDIQNRIARLEQRVQYSLGNGYGRYGYNGNGYGNGYNGYNGYNGQFVDRDGDGRDDNDEHERWHEQHDGDRDD